MCNDMDFDNSVESNDSFDFDDVNSNDFVSDDISENSLDITDDFEINDISDESFDVDTSFEASDFSDDFDNNNFGIDNVSDDYSTKDYFDEVEIIMPLMPAKCPECGGFVEVNSENRSGLCQHC